MENEKESNEAVLIEQLRQEFDQRMRVAEEKWRREMDEWRAKFEAERDKAKADNAIQLEKAKATCVAGQGALKTTIIMNGGASVALLAFIGNTWIHKGGGVAMLSIALFLFAVGVLSGCAATGVTYLAQSIATEENKAQWKVRNNWAIVLWITSCGFFLAGLVFACIIFMTHTLGEHANSMCTG